MATEQSIIAKREREQVQRAAVFSAARDVGPPPTRTPYSRKRRKSCERDLRRFMLTYLAARFDKPFSADHEEVIRDLQTIIIDGGQSAVAMPGGHGKTSLMLAAALWAILYGHRKFLVIIAASEPHASRLLNAIKTQLETNDLLYKDFPEVCHFIRRLNRQPVKAPGQTTCGEPTLIHWGKDDITLPTYKGSASSSSRIEAYGLTGAIRGTSHETPDGRSIRPDLVLVDDPQTDASAKSVSMTRDRLEVIEAAIVGLAGPGVRIAAMAAVTVIEQDDLSSSILNRERYPDWQGRLYKLLVSPPTNQRLWDEYRQIRHASLKAGTGLAPATQFYAANRQAMDEGAVASWAERFNCDEISAVQHAMDLLYKNEAVFYAEYQNSPLARADDAIVRQLDHGELVKRCSGVPRQQVPLESTRLTAFIDLQDESLWYVVCAWTEDFSGDVIDYGVWPRQQRLHFKASEVSPSLSSTYQGSCEACWYSGLKDLCGYLLGRHWQRHGKDEDLSIEKVLIDANYGNSSDTVYKFVRTSGYGSILVPSHGRGITASEKPIDLWNRHIGYRMGMGWRLMPPEGVRRQKHLTYDTNMWKSFVAERLQVPMGDKGALVLYGNRPNEHQLFADHLVSERCTVTFKADNQSRVDIWKLLPSKPDNHWWDCLVGSAVAASLAGLQWNAQKNAARGPAPGGPVVGEVPRAATVGPPARRKVGLAELVARAKSKVGYAA